jgi:hypothetical protein
MVTALDKFEIFTTMPEWYTELPGGLRRFYDDVAESVERVLEKSLTEDGTGST